MIPERKMLPLLLWWTTGSPSFRKGDNFTFHRIPHPDEPCFDSFFDLAMGVYQMEI